MNTFSIKDIENLSGIKAHTWRIWEQRYSLGVPQRKESNHRFYDNENLKQILRISYLYHAGLKISKIALLNQEQIRIKSLENQEEETGYQYYIKELLEASVDLDEEKFEKIFDEALLRIGVEETILKITYPLQAKVGLLWLTDHVIPAQEHFTSNIIRQKLSVAINQLPAVTDTNKKVILLFTPHNEQHELPLQFIYYLLKKNENRVIYFGANVSLESLTTYALKKSFNYLHFHLVTNFTSRSANEYVSMVSRLFPDKQILMSGTEVSQVTEVPSNVILLKSMDAIVAYAREWKFN